MENTASKKSIHDHYESVRKNLDDQKMVYPLFERGDKAKTYIRINPNTIEIDIGAITGQVKGDESFDYLEAIIGKNNPIVVLYDSKDKRYAVICIQISGLDFREHLTKGKVLSICPMPPKRSTDEGCVLIRLVRVEIEKLPGLFRLRPGLDLERIGIHLPEEYIDRYKQSKSGLNMGPLRHHQFAPIKEIDARDPKGVDRRHQLGPEDTKKN